MIMIMTLALLLSFAWREHPDVAICAAFWLSVVSALYLTKLIYRPAGLVVLLGAVCNAVVTVFNGGVMPVVGMPNTFSPAFPIWQAAHGNQGLLTLADHASLYYFSIGDFLLMIGAAILLFSRRSRFRLWLSLAVEKVSAVF